MRVLLLLTTLIALAAGEPVDVVVLIGQSNMDGRGRNEDLPADLRAPSSTVRLWYNNPPLASDGWVPLAPGFSVAPGVKGPLPTGTFGPEISFGPALLAAVPRLRLALLKVSKGGTSLAKDWQAGEAGKAETQGPCYRTLIDALGRAIPALGGHRFRGVVWHQGESDAGLGEGEYQRLLTTFIGRVREDLAVPDLPFVIGEVFDNGKRDHVRAGQRATATSVPRAVLVTCDGLATWDKGTHFDAAGQLEFGRRYAAALAPLIAP